MSRGPLAGVRIVEMAGLGPGPFAGMMLADMGAEIVRLGRLEPSFDEAPWNVVNRGRPTVGVDLTQPEGVELALRLCESADALIEGFRPGVMERLGLGPDVVLERNPRLAYGRMTGYGQSGPMSKIAGHDVNYISVAGALGAMGRHGEAPHPPLNLVGDGGGGGMLLAFGLVCAILEARGSGRGQVVDAAILDGTAILTTMFQGMRGAGLWSDDAGTNPSDGGSHYYNVYATADGGYISVGAIEPQFYAELLRVLELPAADFPQHEPEKWPELKKRFADHFSSRTRDEWAAVLEQSDTCATAVLSLGEALGHPQNAAREVFVEIDGIAQPAPAPRFSRTRPEIRTAQVDVESLFADWGVDRAAFGALRDSGLVRERR